MAGSATTMAMECSVAVDYSIPLTQLISDLELPIAHIDPRIHNWHTVLPYSVQRTFIGFYASYDFINCLGLIRIKDQFAREFRFASFPEVLQCRSLVPHLLSSRRTKIVIPGSLVCTHFMPLILWQEERLHFQLVDDEDDTLNLGGSSVYLTDYCSRD